MKTIKLTIDQQWKLIDRFIQAKYKAGYKNFIKQSAPEIGVWVDDQFFSIDSLVKTLNGANNTNYEV